MNQHCWRIKRRAPTFILVCLLLFCGCSTTRKLTVLPESQRAELLRQSDVVVYARVTTSENIRSNWRLKDTFYMHAGGKQLEDVQFAILSNVKGEAEQPTLQATVEMRTPVLRPMIPGSKWLIGYRDGYRNMFIIYEAVQTNGVARSD